MQEERAVYCHFSFRKPANTPYCIFAVAIYMDEAGKKLIAEKTVAIKPWVDQQHVKAIQAYANALEYIFEKQGKMMKQGINNIIMVTDNTTLHGWIQNPAKHKMYKQYMEKAIKPYRVGGSKEILMTVGLYRVLEREKSHKFCREDLICNKRPTWDSDSEKQEDKNVVTRLSIDSTKAMSIDDIMKADMPKVDWG